MSKKKLANAERVADEAIAKLDLLQDEVRRMLEAEGIDERAEPNVWQAINAAQADAARLREELEGA